MPLTGAAQSFSVKLDDRLSGRLKTRRLIVLVSIVEFVLRTSPSIAPHGPEQDTYLVLDDFGPTFSARAWRETDEDATDRNTLIHNLLSGEYNKPVRIVAFNTAEGWSRDVTADIANELGLRVLERDDIPETVLDFLEANRR